MNSCGMALTNGGKESQFQGIRKSRQEEKARSGSNAA